MKNLSYFVHSPICASLVSAVFLAERLQCYAKVARLQTNQIEHTNESCIVDVSEEAIIHILATTYHRSGKSNRACAILKDCKRADNRYLSGVCWFSLGKYEKVEQALLIRSSSKDTSNDHVSKRAKTSDDNDDDALNGDEIVAGGAAGYYILGCVCRRTSRQHKAIEYFRKALEIDSCHWAAYEALCDLGYGYATNEWFKPDSPSLRVPIISSSSLMEELTTTIDRSSVHVAPSEKTPLQTPTIAQQQQQQPQQHHQQQQQPLTPPRIGTRISRKLDIAHMSVPREGALSFGDASHDNNNTFDTPDHESEPVVPRVVRRSARLNKRKGTTKTPATTATTNNTAIPPRKPPKATTNMTKATPIPFPSTFDTTKDAAPQTQQHVSHENMFVSLRPLSTMMKTIGNAYYQMCQYKCKEAYEILISLPPEQRDSGWVLAQLGRCEFEMVNYPKAVETFRLLRKIEPHRMEGLEYFSTALWHLKQEVDLSHLAQQVADFDKLCPQTWVVVGNCFSLQKEHETALKFFHRAIQIDPFFPYAYTLSGHEYVANEDFDKAIARYRHAINVDERHYNAWYGMGNIYYRQEKLELASYHFQRALRINNRSSVLYCYLGMVLHANRRFDVALEMLNKADEIDPSNPLAKFQKAQVHVSLEEYDAAAYVLEELNAESPKEAAVHFLLGKVYKKLQQIDKASMHLTMALELDPKDRNQIKSVMDRLYTDADDSLSDTSL